MLDELEVANELGLKGTDYAKKRRVRSIYRDIGVDAYKESRDTWLIPRKYIEIIKDELCHLKSPQERERRTYTYEARSRVSRSMKAQAKLNEMLRSV